jgi:hypothetical protein
MSVTTIHSDDVAVHPEYAAFRLPNHDAKFLFSVGIAL